MTRHRLQWLAGSTPRRVGLAACVAAALLGAPVVFAERDASVLEPVNESVNSAATRAEITLAALNEVSVFYLAHDGGRPVTLPTPEGTRVAPVFFYRAAALSMREEILAGPAAPDEDITDVRRAGLGRVYLDKEARFPDVEFLLIADDRQVQNARRIKSAEDFNQVPVFVARQASSGGFVTMVGSDGSPVMPVFMEAERLEDVMAEMTRMDAGLAGDIVMDAMPLDELVGALLSGQVAADQVQMIPQR